MKLTAIETFVVGNPPPHFGGRYFVFVKLSTDNGSTGLGEAYCVPFSPHLVAQMCEDVFARYMEGQDPHDIEKMWRRVYSSGFTQHPDLTLMGVMSALEMACWDIVGKEAGQPVYKLLGGQVHEALRSYTYIYPRPGDQSDVYHDPDLAAERAALYLDMGFTALKFDPAGPYSAFDGRQLSLEALDLSERFCKALREAVGSRADLLFGTHGQMTAAGAIRLAKRLEKYDPLWLEEPVPPDAPEEMAKVARATSIPIATGERLTTKYDFARLLDCGAAAILQMNLGRVGGLLEAKKIAGMAEVRHVQIAPHLYCGPVVGAANVQLATCSPNFLILESIEDWSGFHAQILKTPMHFEQGHVIPPNAPGLGIELNEEVARAHPYTGDMLHLEMTQNPVR
ncbi:mandelate racemase/muconate lactonizing enzyme family protein [Novosphingobium sp.]|uniref:mandelate racemase/muconate lactonizing enzyme family protein n=1 Tax=Novosphingobium sp. TaxID=1874826 RepID=UPI0025F1D38B|nr:mandelate racemase/muconate lactonizing enzyme family protein [Novosphingobium sp.]MCC6924229.1 mandelate racemase/muconate lactonizing enzyme family protein [Novosphingobium sp.]